MTIDLEALYTDLHRHPELSFQETRTAGLIAHLAEEAETPSGFALSYQATRELQYEGSVPDGFGEAP